MTKVEDIVRVRWAHLPEGPSPGFRSSGDEPRQQAAIPMPLMLLRGRSTTLPFVRDGYPLTWPG